MLLSAEWIDRRHVDGVGVGQRVENGGRSVPDRDNLQRDPGASDRLRRPRGESRDRFEEPRGGEDGHSIERHQPPKRLEISPHRVGKRDVGQVVDAATRATARKPLQRGIDHHDRHRGFARRSTADGIRGQEPHGDDQIDVRIASQLVECHLHGGIRSVADSRQGLGKGNLKLRLHERSNLVGQAPTRLDAVCRGAVEDNADAHRRRRRSRQGRGQDEHENRRQLRRPTDPQESIHRGSPSETGEPTPLKPGSRP